MSKLNVNLISAIVILTGLLGASTYRNYQKSQTIQKLQNQVENLYSINKFQEEVLRSCGVYGEEE